MSKTVETENLVTEESEERFLEAQKVIMTIRMLVRDDMIDEAVEKLLTPSVLRLQRFLGLDIGTFEEAIVEKLSSMTNDEIESYLDNEFGD